MFGSSVSLIALALPLARGALAPMTYLPVPLPQVKPSGWLKDQLTLQANGLAGSLQTFYPLVTEGPWQGGAIAYSDLDESEPYHFNALIGTAYQLGIEEMKDWILNFTSVVLASEQSDGWIGPDNDILWSRYLIFVGFMQLSDAEPSLTDSLVDAMYNFAAIANSKLKSSDTGIEDWGAVRPQEYQLSLQWLYDNHPRNESTLEMLVETMALLDSVGCEEQSTNGEPYCNWAEFFTDENFNKDGYGPINQFSHGVNLAMALKGASIQYRYTLNTSYIDQAYERLNLTFAYHGAPAGHFNADEHLAGLEPWRGAEYCQIVEDVFSMSYNYLILGNNSFADRAESIIYNSFPAQSTSNMWSHQYLQQPNQYEAGDLSDNPFLSDGSYSDVFGLEPNYPCCTVNHGQGMPKFVMYSFVYSSDKTSLIQVYHGPFTVETTLGTSNNVKVTTQTVYPFDLTTDYTVTADEPFTFFVRIPGWVSGGTITTDGISAPLAPNEDNLHGVSISGREMKFTITFEATTTTPTNYDGSISVHRGPLTYAIDLGYNQTQLVRPAYFYMPDEESFPTPAEVIDWQFLPAETWNLGIDPSTLTFVSGNLTTDSTLPNPIFEHDVPPVYFTATGCAIANWTTVDNSYVEPIPANPTCEGDTFEIRLSPWGATKLRIGYIPVVSITSTTS